MERDRIANSNDPSLAGVQFLSEHRLAMLADVSNVDFWTIKPDGSVVLLSDPSRRNEFNFPGAITEKVVDLIHPEDRTRFIEEWHRAKDSDRRIEVKYRYLIEDEYRWQRARALPIQGESGEIHEWLGVTEDIHDAILTENGRDRFFDVALDLTAVCDYEAHFKRLGSKWTEVLGWSAEELLASPIIDFLHPDDSKSAQRIMARLKHNHELGEFETRVRTKDGYYRWVSWRILPFPEEQIIYVSATDITDRRIAEESLRSSEEMYRSILTNAAIGIVQISLEGHINQLNEAFSSMLGYSKSEMLGICYENVCDPSGFPEAIENIKDLLSGKSKSYRRNTQLIRRDGSKVWGHITVSLVRDQEGRPAYYIAIVEDISASKAIEDALIESEDHYRFMVDSSPQMPWTANPDGTMTDFSDRWLTLTGLTRDKTDDNSWRNVIHPDDFDALLLKWRHSVTTGTPYEAEHRTRIADGTYRWMRARAVARRDHNGNIIRWYGSTEDIHGQKQFEVGLENLVRERTHELDVANQELTQARDAALAASKSKSVFLANMSHEIRTPMNAVIGLTSLLQTMQLPPEAHSMIETIAGSGETLLRVIDDILDFSRIEANKLEIERTPVGVDDLATDVVTLFQGHAKARGIILRKSAPDKAMPQVMGDPVRLRQVISNLISNAIKFTTEGEVVLRWSWEFLDGRLLTQLEVQDTGVGIPPDRIDAIFESFTQADESTQRQYGGTGLGLTISRRLVELMGGTISVKSQLGSGTTFTVQLPFELAPVESESIKVESALVMSSRTGPLHVLLAEDNEVNVLVASKMLEHVGCTVEVAENGIRAIALADTHSFDFVLMDVQMPVCDGLEATRIIRINEAQKGRPHVPIYALTANAMSGDRQICLDAGMDGFLAKPIPVAALHQVVSEVLDKMRSKI